ncbi:MAG: phosphoglycerate mutase family protein [Ferruginibacter sp.]
MKSIFSVISKKKNWLSFLFMFLVVHFGNAQQIFPMKKGVIYIVRHSEKDTGINPGLTVAGRMRNGYLASALKSKKNYPDRIYVTQFRRTQQTADSIFFKGINDTTHYVADNNGDGLINQLKKHRRDNNIVVIAHSNTIPVLIKRLGINESTVAIADNEYDNLFRIVYRKSKATLSRRKFGVSVPKSDSIWKVL